MTHYILSIFFGVGSYILSIFFGVGSYTLSILTLLIFGNVPSLVVGFDLILRIFFVAFTSGNACACTKARYSKYKNPLQRKTTQVHA
jgi:hypothetical protein